MLIKEWELNKFLENIINFNAILIHGPDRGKVNEKSELIYKKFLNMYEQSVEKIIFNHEKFFKSNSYISELVYQKSIFNKYTIIIVNLDLLKIDKDFIFKFETLDPEKSNFIILESKYLPNSSKILNMFKDKKNFLLLTCYQDVNIKKSIMQYVKEYSLSIDHDGLEYLSNKFGNDSMITKSEIKKLALYANGEKISFNDILDAIGDNSILNLNSLCDAIGIEKIDRVNYLYDKASNLAINHVTILRSIGKHLHMLILAKSKKLKDIKDYRPSIHFSRHKKINKQLNNIDIITLRKYAKYIANLEVSCKLSTSINDLLIKKLLFNIINY